MTGGGVRSFGNSYFWKQSAQISSRKGRGCHPYALTKLVSELNRHVNENPLRIVRLSTELIAKGKLATIKRSIADVSSVNSPFGRAISSSL